MPNECRAWTAIEEAFHANEMRHADRVESLLLEAMRYREGGHLSCPKCEAAA
jgi:hypothetical protein